MRPSLALTGAFVWDGLREQRSPEPCTVRVEDGRITAMGSDPCLSEKARVFPLDGATILPGLIDSHVHMGLDPHITSPDDQLAVPPTEQATGMAARALAMVRAGITTARDLGGPGWLELTLRDRIDSGQLVGPRLLCAGQPVTTPGGHCHFWGGEAASDAEIRAVIERQIEHGADWIKVMATGGVFTRGSSPRAAQFDVDQLAVVVDESSAHGRSVAAHCHGTDGIRNAAAAGVRTIEHCSFMGRGGFGTALDDSVAERITQAGAFVSPTVNSGWGRRIEHAGRPTRFFLRMARVLGTLKRCGVQLIASTDAGIPGVEHHRLPEALLAFSRYADLTPARTLQSATSVAARALGLSEEIGALRVGLAADLLVVDGDPLQDLSVLQSPRMVIARGIVVE